MVVSTFLINTCVKAILLLIGTGLIEQGKLTPEVLLAFMLYQGQLQGEVVNLLNSYSSLIKSSGAGDKVFGLLDREPPPPATGSPAVISSETQAADADNPHNTQISVQLRDVHFHYPTRPSHQVLNGLNLVIPAGKTVALVGPSGCGKSTIIGLLQRWFDSNRGEVLIDGIDLRSMDIKSYRYVVQFATVLLCELERKLLMVGCSWRSKAPARHSDPRSSSLFWDDSIQHRLRLAGCYS